MSNLKQKILFMVHTEYHMMVALSLIADKFSDSEIYRITICQTQDYAKKRFQFQKNTTFFPGLEYEVLDYEEKAFEYNEDLHKYVHKILNTGFDVFVMFNHHSFLPVYLSKQLAKRGTRIFLAPDGLKPYSNSKRLTLRWSFKTALNFYRFTKAHKLSYFLYYPTVEYANLKEIEKVYIHFPHAYKNLSNKEVEVVNVLESENAKKLVGEYFQFSVNNKELYEKTIFYINQPVQKEDIYTYELDALKELKNKFPDFNFIIKLHPATDSDQINKIRSIEYIHVITESYPAELYIAELKNSVVLSFWSTSCLIENKHNVKNYWLFPALVKNNIMLSYVKVLNPAEHIMEISSIDEIGD